MPSEVLPCVYPAEDQIGMFLLQGCLKRSVTDDDELYGSSLNRCMARYAATATLRFFSGATRPT